MEQNSDVMAKLKRLNESELKALINEIARSAGMSEGMRRAALAHTGMIRRKLQTASEEDLKKVMQSLGQDKTNDILKKLDR